MPYTTVDDVVQWIRLTPDSKIDQGKVHEREILIEGLIAACDKSINTYTHRDFNSYPNEVHTFYPVEGYVPRNGILIVGDFHAVTSVVLNGDIVLSGVYIPISDMRDHPYRKLLFPSGIHSFNHLEMTSDWGWSAIPSTVSLASKMQVARYYQRSKTPSGVYLSPEGEPMRIMRLDYDICMMLDTVGLSVTQDQLIEVRA